MAISFCQDLCNVRNALTGLCGQCKLRRRCCVPHCLARLLCQCARNQPSDKITDHDLPHTSHRFLECRHPADSECLENLEGLSVLANPSQTRQNFSPSRCSIPSAAPSGASGIVQEPFLIKLDDTTRPKLMLHNFAWQKLTRHRGALAGAGLAVLMWRRSINTQQKLGSQQRLYRSLMDQRSGKNHEQVIDDWLDFRILKKKKKKRKNNGWIHLVNWHHKTRPANTHTLKEHRVFFLQKRKTEAVAKVNKHWSHVQYWSSSKTSRKMDSSQKRLVLTGGPRVMRQMPSLPRQKCGPPSSPRSLHAAPSATPTFGPYVTPANTGNWLFRQTTVLQPRLRGQRTLPALSPASSGYVRSFCRTLLAWQSSRSRNGADLLDLSNLAYKPTIKSWTCQM